MLVKRVKGVWGWEGDLLSFGIIKNVCLDLKMIKLLVRIIYIYKWSENLIIK